MNVLIRTGVQLPAAPPFSPSLLLFIDMSILLKHLLENENPSKSISDIKRLVPKMVRAAQKVYNEWDQSDPDNDELCGGGICQDIADRIASVLNSHGIDAATVDNQGMGEQHVWTVAKVDDGVYEIDIPPNNYERGGGYTWKKIPDVEFTPNSLYIGRLSVDPEDFENYVGS